MPTTNEQRTVDFSAVFNFRDLGGLPLADGASVRPGVVFRADGLHRMPEDDIVRLRELGISTVVDLRTTTELEATRLFESAGVTVVHLPMIRSTWDEHRLDTIDDPVTFLVERYLAMLDEGSAAIASTFEMLATEARRPLVFHCSAGKDRTGVLAALVLSAVGVADDDVASDYASSAAAMTKLVEWVRSQRSAEAANAMSAQPAAFLSCPEDAMHRFLERLRAQHGSVEAYLDGIGVTPSTLEAVRAALT